MEWQWPVHPALAGLVERMVGYAYTLDPAAVHHGVPGPVVTVVVSFQEPLDVGWLGDPGSARRTWMLASGLATRPALIRTHGRQHGIQLDLTPLGCRVLLGAPMSEFAEALAEAGELPGALDAAVHERLSERSTFPRRLALLEGHLLRVAAGSRAQLPADLDAGWRLLAEHAGGVRTAQLAGRLGWSRRHLVTRFRSEFGLPPSEVARLHRLGAAIARARSGRTWSDVAAATGFADQAHLTREFRALTGQTPARWRAEVFPILQDGPTGEGSG